MIARLTNKDRAFYFLLGPYLSNRNIVKELGSPLWDDDDKTWYCDTERDELRGFAAMRTKNATTIFCSAYVQPAHRGNRVYAGLLFERLADAPVGIIRTVATPASLPSLIRVGFHVVSPRGRFTKLEMTKE